MSEWKEYKLGDVIEKFIGGGTPSKAVDEYWNGNIPWASVKDIQDGNYRINSTIDSISKLGLNNSSSNLIPKGTVIIVTRMSLGRCFVADFDVAINQDLKALIPKKNYLNNEFLLWLIVSLSKKIDFLGTGSTVKGITLESLKQNISIKLPPLEEQKRIADVLSCLDAKIENLRKQNNTLEQIAQTLFKHWFIDFEFPNTDGKPYKSSGGEMQSSVLGDIPKGWRVGKIGEEVETLGGGTPSTTEPSYWENGNIIWYSPTDLTSSKTLFSLGSDKKITKLGLSKSSAKLFPAYSLLLTSRATVGVITINTKPACTNQGFITIIPNKKYSVYFLHSWLLRQVKRIQLLASGSTFPEISKTDFRNLDFLIPKDDVLDDFQGRIKPIYRKIEINTQQIETLTKTRDALLPKLMSGQIRIEE